MLSPILSHALHVITIIVTFMSPCCLPWLLVGIKGLKKWTSRYCLFNDEECKLYLFNSKLDSTSCGLVYVCAMSLCTYVYVVCVCMCAHNVCSCVHN